VSARIAIDFAVAEGAVIRAIGLIERRGFVVHGLGMTEHDGGETASMVIELSPRDASRRLDVLDLQLRRLHGVTHVSTFNPQEEVAS
jgi:acetolactate synthase-1/3 small subunit/acetolactate synthase II small subunit